MRIPGVILERSRAQELYQEIRSRRIDPGLMEVEDPERSLNEFSAKVVPIPPHGTKRIEMEYTQELDTVGGETRFSLPLAPNRYHKQWADKFSMVVRFEDTRGLESISVERPNWEFRGRKVGETAAVSEFQTVKAELSSDVDVTFRRMGVGVGLDFRAYRDPLTDRDRQKRTIHGFSDKSEDGYFSARGASTHARKAQFLPGAEIWSETRKEAVALFQSLLGELAADLPFQQGDLQILNSHVTLHTRRPYEDWDDQAKKRHLFRLWLKNDDLRPVPQKVRENFSGIEVEGFSPRAPLEAEEAA